MNQLNRRDDAINYYFTAVYLLIDTERRTIEYVNAGHPPGMLFEVGKPVTLLNRGCAAVGFFEQLDISKGSVTYEQPIRLYLYTDGLLEAIEEEGKDEIEQLITGLQSCGYQDIGCVIDRLLPPEIRDAQEDDICMVMVQTL